MKKLITLTKTLLVLAGLCVGVNAWADGEKRVLESENYENATAADWTSSNGVVSLQTGDATYGNYANIAVSGNGNRSCYKSVTFDYEAGTGYNSAEMTTKGYVIEFDMQMSGGNTANRSVSQFIIPTTGPNLATNDTYKGTDYIFALSQPTVTSTSRSTTWFINDLTNETGTTATLSYSVWYHYKFVVSATTVGYEITHNNKTDASGSLTVSSLPTITGFFGLLGRGAGYIKFDNLEIYDYTEELTISSPTITFKKVDGANRIYTLTNPNESGTLCYTTEPAESAPEVGSDAYTTTTETSLDVTYGESGKYYAYVLHSNGTTVSAITEQNVTAGALTLATPTFTIIDMIKSVDGYYYPKVTFASNNSTLEGAPTAAFDVTSPYTFTATGSITVTASATGYTSSSNTFTVANAYAKSKTIDFGALTASDFDETVWESATGVPRDYWTNRAAALPADVTYYKLIDKTAETSSTALADITISNVSTHDPQVYIGYGLLTPYYQGVSGNNMNFTVNGGTAEDLIVYNGWNNYGSGTFNTVLAGNATFGLYRYDTMLRTINVFSPIKDVPATIGAAGYATFSNPDFALDFTGTAVKAYTASLTSDYTIVLKPVTQVPANTGLVLAGEEGTYDIPVITEAAAITGNLLKPSADEVIAASTDALHHYVLAKRDDNVGFYNLATAKNIGAGKAYLETTDALATTTDSRVAWIFADGTTGIKTTNLTNDTNETIYNLNGQRVAAPQKGLYIVNGKKVIMK